MTRTLKVYFFLMLHYDAEWWLFRVTTLSRVLVPSRSIILASSSQIPFSPDVQMRESKLGRWNNMFSPNSEGFVHHFEHNFLSRLLTRFYLMQGSLWNIYKAKEMEFMEWIESLWNGSVKVESTSDGRKSKYKYTLLRDSMAHIA